MSEQEQAGGSAHSPVPVLILGAGRGGSAMLELLSGEQAVRVVGILDSVADAPGMIMAREQGIPVFCDLHEAVEQSAPAMVFNLTHDESLGARAASLLGREAVIGGLQAHLFWNMVTGLKQARDCLRHEATHDALTGILNRRGIIERAASDLKEAQRYGFSFTVAILDIDHFKRINDQFGHDCGDAVLQQMAKTLQRGMRLHDSLGRWGGEEFLVLLPHTGGKDAVAAARHWLASLQAAAIECRGQRIPLAFSAGVASLCEVEEASLDALQALADQRLYQAKEAGRARVVGPQD